MSTFFEDIIAEPAALRRSLDYNVGEGHEPLLRAASAVRAAKMVYITGIGSSWHAGMAVQSLFDMAGRPAILVDASELLHYTRFPDNSCLIALSRSGRSVEIVKLLDKAQAAGATVIGITNTMDSPLAQRAAVALSLEAPFDRNVSVTMYSALTLVGGLLAAASLGNSLADLAPVLRQLLLDAQSMLDVWQSQISKSAWVKSDLPTYFLARGGSMASCSEARLLWEEAAKSAATSMTTGGFRHGPQEVLVTGARIGLWITPNTLRNEDLSLAQDLREQGVPTMVIGPDVRPDAADLVLPIHRIPRQLSHWQFLVDVIPAQLLSAEFVRYRGANCNEFAFCPYVIESEGGLVGARLTQPGTPS